MISNHLNQHSNSATLSSCSNNLIEDSKTGPLALRLCKECGGLPLLVETFANAFRLNHSEHDWVDGLISWKMWPEQERKGIGEVYNSLKSCYDELLNDCKKKCFLYVALYPEGCHIDSDHLLEYWIVEGLFRPASSHLITTESLKLAKGVLSHLNDVFLLDDGKTKHYVTMHKFARVKAPCLLENDSHLKHLVKTNGALREPPGEELWIDKNMENLRVLDLSDTGITSFPSSIWSSKTLKSLILINCKHLKSLFPDVTYMDHLEAFKFQRSGLQALDIRGSGITNITCVGLLKQLRRLRVSFVQSSSAFAALDEGFNHKTITSLFLLEDLVIDVTSIDYQRSNELVGNIMIAVSSLSYYNTLKFILSNQVIHAIDATNDTLRVHAPNGRILQSFIKESRWRNSPSIKQFHLVSRTHSSVNPVLASHYGN